MRRPLMIVAVPYVAGILLGRISLPLPLLFGAAFLTAFLFLIWARARSPLLGLLLLLLGWTNIAQRSAILSRDDLRNRLTSEAQIIGVRGVLAETPYIRIREIEGIEVPTSMARLNITEIRSGSGNWQPATGQILCRAVDVLPENIFKGQTVETSGIVSQPRRAIAEGLFDYRNFLEEQGIYFQLKAPDASGWKIISSPAKAPLADRFNAWARKNLAVGLPTEDLPLRLEWALTLGWKEALTDQVTEPFTRAGTYHIFAVDGLRMAIIAGILLTLFRVLGIRRSYCALLALPFLWFYAGMTGWPASAMRALVMITIVFGGWILNRPSDLINSLFAAALIILVWNPLQLFQAGFQLSFLVVLCIILIMPFFNKIGEWLLRPNPLRPESMQPEWQRTLLLPIRYVVDLFLASVAAWLGSIPLVAWYFHLVTPSSGPANILAVPLCVLVLICNFVSFFLTGWLPSIGGLFNHAGWFCMKCICNTSDWAANVPGAYFYAGMPALFSIGLYYFILIALLTGWLFQGRRQIKLSATGLLILVWLGLCVRDYHTSRLTILPLNGGYAVYAKQSQHEQRWLIDCGNEDAVKDITAPFLEAQGVNRLPNLLLTHGEAGYSGGAENIATLFHPRNIYTSSIHFRSPDYLEFESRYFEKPNWRAPVKQGDQLGPWRVLYPPAEKQPARADDNPVVLIGEFNGARVLLLSDLSHLGQNSLLASGVDLHADIVVGGLPNSSEPFSGALIAAVQPRIIVVADSTYPASKRAGRKLKARLGQRKVPILYASDSDAITFTSRGKDWTLTAMDGTQFSSATVNDDRPGRQLNGGDANSELDGNDSE